MSDETCGVPEHCICGRCGIVEQVFDQPSDEDYEAKIKSLKAEIAQLKLIAEAHKYCNAIEKNLRDIDSQLKQPQWVSVDGAESDLKLEGYYWWNPRYSENRKEENWQVVYCNPKGTDMINRQGLFSGPLPTPPETE